MSMPTSPLMQRKRYIFILFFGILLIISSCSISVNVKDSTPFSGKFDKQIQGETLLKINDLRAGEDKQLSVGRINFVLENMEDEILFLGNNLEKVFHSRGINLKNTKGEADFTLDVLKYQIINRRISGFHPLWTYAMFSGDLKINNKIQRISFYWLADRVPVWSMDEINDPCFNIPVSLMVKEIAAKINRYYFNQKASNEEVKAITDEVNNNFNESSYLKVLELGYTNNDSAIDPLIKLTNHDDVYIRVSAICALGMLSPNDQLEFLKNYYKTKNDIEKAMALKTIGDLASPEAMNFIKSVKESSDYEDEMIRLVVDLYVNPS